MQIQFVCFGLNCILIYVDALIDIRILTRRYGMKERKNKGKSRTRILSLVLAAALAVTALTGLAPEQAFAKKAKSKPHLSETSAELYEGQMVRLKVLDAPSDAKITYRSDSEDIARVTERGEVFAQNDGQTKIRVTVKKNKKRKWKMKFSLTVKDSESYEPYPAGPGSSLDAEQTNQFFETVKSTLGISEGVVEQKPFAIAENGVSLVESIFKLTGLYPKSQTDEKLDTVIDTLNEVSSQLDTLENQMGQMETVLKQKMDKSSEQQEMGDALANYSSFVETFVKPLKEDLDAVTGYLGEEIKLLIDNTPSIYAYYDTDDNQGYPDPDDRKRSIVTGARLKDNPTEYQLTYSTAQDTMDKKNLYNDYSVEAFNTLLSCIYDDVDAYVKNSVDAADADKVKTEIITAIGLYLMDKAMNDYNTKYANHGIVNHYKTFCYAVNGNTAGLGDLKLSFVETPLQSLSTAAGCYFNFYDEGKYDIMNAQSYLGVLLGKATCFAEVAYPYDKEEAELKDLHEMAFNGIYDESIVHEKKDGAVWCYPVKSYIKQLKNIHVFFSTNPEAMNEDPPDPWLSISNLDIKPDEYGGGQDFSISPDNGVITKDDFLTIMRRSVFLRKDEENDRAYLQRMGLCDPNDHPFAFNAQKVSFSESESKSHSLKCVETWGAKDGAYFFNVGDWYDIKTQTGNSNIYDICYDYFCHGAVKGDMCDLSSGNASYSDTILESAGYSDYRSGWRYKEVALLNIGADYWNLGYDDDNDEGGYSCDLSSMKELSVLQKTN